MNTIITLEEAIAQGSTPGDLRTLANGLDRLGRAHLADKHKEQANVNFQNAHAFRKMARDIARKK